MMSKIDLMSHTLSELESALANAGFPAYRAKQLYSWVYGRGVSDPAAMANLPKLLRAYLAANADLTPCFIASERVSRLDSTRKLLMRLKDGLSVETVLMGGRDKATVCASTQVGCALGCAFCATGRMGLARNLSAGEIVGQVLALCSRPPGGAAQACEEGRTVAPGYDPPAPGAQARLNVVFMGMGEPLANCPALFKAIRILNDPNGLAVGARRMTVSTAGLPRGIRRLRSLDLQVGLAVSLNAATDELRSKLMPINKRYSLKQVIGAAADYAAARGRRVTLEYVMLGGVNDRLKDAAALASIASQLPCKINLIEYNACPGALFRPPVPAALARFVEYLYRHGPAVMVRSSKGADIDAACGQLSTACGGRSTASGRRSTASGGRGKAGS